MANENKLTTLEQMRTFAEMQDARDDEQEALLKQLDEEKDTFVKYSQQTMTDEEKAQARENIGIEEITAITNEEIDTLSLDWDVDNDGNFVPEGSGSVGQQGPAGKSAYEYAIEGGYTGTEEEFSQKLASDVPDEVYIGSDTPTDPNVKIWINPDEDAPDNGGTVEIPETLPNPHPLTFTGAVEATYDGSEPVAVNIPSAATGGSAGGGYKPLTLLYEKTLDADTTEFSQEIEPCDVVELHILNYSAADILGNTFHRVCPNRKSDGAAVANYPIKLPSAVTSGGAMEAVYRFERHEGFINLFCWISARNPGNGNSARSVQFQTMWDNSRFGGSASFAYTNKIDFINFTGLTLASGVIIQIYGQKQG